MDKIFTTVQFILALIVFICAVSATAVHIIMGNIATLGSFAVSALIIVITFSLAYLSWDELKNVKQ